MLVFVLYDCLRRFLFVFVCRVRVSYFLVRHVVEGFLDVCMCFTLKCFVCLFLCCFLMVVVCVCSCSFGLFGLCVSCRCLDIVTCFVFACFV